MKKIKLFEAFVNESKEEAEAQAILQDLMDEFDPWELVDMLPKDAEDTVASYGHKGAKAKKIADYLLSMAQNGEFESVVTEAKGKDLIQLQNLDWVDHTRLIKFISKEFGKLDVNVTKTGGYTIDPSKLSDKEVEILLDYLRSQKYIIEQFIDEAWVGPFQFNDKMSDDELKKMYDEALSGYANWQKGFEYPKSDYKKAYQEIEKILKKKGVVVESAINEAKALDTSSMIQWIEQYMKFVRTTEEFDGSTGGIWVSGENGDTFKGKRIYDYYNETKAYDLGVLVAWEKELNKRGWYSEWYDAGTVMIWQD